MADPAPPKASTRCSSISVALQLLLLVVMAVCLPFLQSPRPAPFSVSLGGVSSHSVRVWAHSDSASRFRVHISKADLDDDDDDDDDVVVVGEWTVFNKAKQNCSVSEIGGLEAGTRYRFEVELDDGSSASRGSFATLEEAKATGLVEFVFGSCTHSSPFGSVSGLSFVAKEIKPDFVLLLGDLVYRDVPFRQPFSDVYRRTVADQGMVDIGRSVPMFTMYDDHEVENDWNQQHSLSLFEEAMDYFQAFFAQRNPPSLEPGEMYYSFDAGPTSFFVLDTRKHSNPETKQMLGEVQKQHLYKWLCTSKAVFKFMASPVAWSRQASKLTDGDAWLSFLEERNEIFSFIEQHNITGVVPLSGDIHWSGIFKLEPYSFLTEFSASPIQSFPLTPVPWASFTAGDEKVLYWNAQGKHFGRMNVHVPEDRRQAYVVFVDYVALPLTSTPKPRHRFVLHWKQTVPFPSDAS